MTDRLIDWLHAAGVAFDVLQHAPARTSEESAAARGTALEDGAKALVVRAEERYVHLVVPAHRRVDNTALRAILGTRKLRFATPEELLALTMCAPGAVPPFGNLFGLPVVVDEELTRRDRIVFNAGSHRISIRMAAADFVRLSGATIARFTRS